MLRRYGPRTKEVAMKVRRGKAALMTTRRKIAATPPDLVAVLILAAAAVCQALADLRTQRGLVLVLVDLALTLFVVATQAQRSHSTDSGQLARNVMLVSASAFFAAVVARLLMPSLARSGLFVNILAVTSYLTKAVALVVMYGTRLISPPQGLLAPKS
jgi:hypothetical protein